MEQCSVSHFSQVITYISVLTKCQKMDSRIVIVISQWAVQLTAYDLRRKTTGDQVGV